MKIANEEITSLVWKVGSEGKDDGHPTYAAISQLRSAYAADPQWHPSKHEEHGKPTASQVIARCPAAATNPSTGESFDEKLI